MDRLQEGQTSVRDEQAILWRLIQSFPGFAAIILANRNLSVIRTAVFGILATVVTATGAVVAVCYECCIAQGVNLP
jgi:hypothetical protein